MVLVVALPAMAKRIADLEILEGPHSYVVAVRDDKDLRHKVYEHQPEIVLLDWRMGGSGWRVFDQIPLLVERTASQPYIIGIVPWVNREVEKDVAAKQAYNIVVFNEKKERSFVRDLCAALGVAQKARAARKLKPNPRARDRMFH